MISKLEGWVLHIRQKLPKLRTESGITDGEIKFLLWTVRELRKVNSSNLFFNIVPERIENSSKPLVTLNVSCPLFVLVLHNWGYFNYFNDMIFIIRNFHSFKDISDHYLIKENYYIQFLLIQFDIFCIDL